VQAPIPPEVAIEEIVVAPDAVQRLAAFARCWGWDDALLVVDANTEVAAGLRATFRYAGRLRAPYTTLDFLEGQGALDSALDQVLPG
jgi:hypothetical protein